MDIYLIDGIGPFFRNYTKERINWSKIPFQHLKLDDENRLLQFAQIREDMDTLAKAVSRIGYNSISLDDVAHLTTDPWHTPQTNTNIRILQEEFRRIFSLLKKNGLNIYLTMDIISLTAELRERIQNNKKNAFLFLSRQIDTVLRTFPEISGVILRVGECDGKDVKDRFKSELLLKKPSQLNKLLHVLIPIFEQHNRTIILRNWTVGAYSIGDFIWHRGTSKRVLKGIDSPNFILSMKYGESDFFRYLPLNKHFFRIKVKKIIEFQARREYEGCGEYPSFIGWDYQKYAQLLEQADNMAGISVWCQTGGWVPFRRLTYLEESGIWNELNSFVTLQLFQKKMGVEEAVARFAEEKNIHNLPLFSRTTPA